VFSIESRASSPRRYAGLGLLVAMSLALTGCTSVPGSLWSVQNHPQEAGIVYSSPVRSGVTPMDEALTCLAERIQRQRSSPLNIAVGDIRDYTGKQSPDEGFIITQGGALMAYSALGKMQGAVRIHERLDTRVAEMELVYSDRRQLGDGQMHTVPSNDGGDTTVPWRPYLGGSIIQSDYFIVGGITELNYNIRSGGAEVSISNLGPRARTFTMNVAIDLRIVGTQSLLVYDTVSIEKQITGYEVGFGVFRFFGSDLFDINIGERSQEPLQLAVRTAIEAGVAQLVASIARVDPLPCMPEVLQPVHWNGAGAPPATAAVAPASTGTAPSTAALGYAGPALRTPTQQSTPVGAQPGSPADGSSVFGLGITYNDPGEPDSF